MDGGSSESDILLVDDSGDVAGLDTVLNVTRNVVEVPSMALSNTSNALRDNYLISLRGATNGTFDLVITESLNSTVFSQTITVPAATNASALEILIQDTLFPEAYKSSCGSTGITECSQSVKVIEFGAGFLISFLGERLNQGVGVNLLTENLVDYESEMFQNWTNDILERQSDLAYGNIERLDITMGHAETILNIRGTSAKTTVTTQNKDDYVFVSSEANQESSNAEVVGTLVFVSLLFVLQQNINIRQLEKRSLAYLGEIESKRRGL